MVPLRKLLGEPVKLGFYGYFYVRYAILRLLGRTRPVTIAGTAITRSYLAWKIFRLLGLDPVAARDGAMPFMSHVDATRTAPAAGINGRCCDITKSRIADIFAEVAGYELRVDPLRHEGEMVCKSEANSTHDGAVVVGPLTATEPDRAYQRLIDNRHDGKTAVDLRPCVVGDEIPFTYVKYRPLADRFSDRFSHVVAQRTETIFSAGEITLILRFCRRIGLDLGELDVLRDRTDGRIYIVDVATTPNSPGDSFIGLAGARRMGWAADAFRRQFLDRRH